MANLSELIRQKEQQTEEWKQRKADERDSLNDMNDAAALRVTESTGAFLHYLDVQAEEKLKKVAQDWQNQTVSQIQNKAHKEQEKATAKPKQPTN